MKTIYSDQHFLRNAKTELYGGNLVPPFECPKRAELILSRINEQKLGPIIEPTEFGLEPVLEIHDEDFVDFLKSAYSEWQAEGFTGEAIATAWPARRMAQKTPCNIDGKLGYYALAAETAICPGTYDAAIAAKDVALTGAKLIHAGERAAFALCRPPGHHAALDMYGGYCFLNNAAIAAQYLLDQGAKQIAILDVDFHHGNGTQDIFYHRDDVLFISLHGQPEEAFPYFLGYGDETGRRKGKGFNLNFPMPPGTDFATWNEALGHAINHIESFGPDALIISLGVDTFKDDPISFFKLNSPDFCRYGNSIAKLNLPTLFVMEGGYAIDDVGINTVNVLTGFLGD